MTSPYSTKGSQRRLLLLTFDAFSTLFHPRRPVAELYASVAHSYGLSPTVITPAKLQKTFKEAFKTQSRRFPNYGREEVLRGRYGGPRQWWSEVIQASFARALGGEVEQLPHGMTEYLLDLFASQKGYALYEDVAPLFEKLTDLKRRGVFDRIVTGVISNSDDRVPAVLKCLRLKVGDVRADRDWSSMELPGFEERKSVAADQVQSPSDNDIDMIITSYEAGEEKPHRLIFDVAKQQAKSFVRTHDSALVSDIEDGSARWFWLHIGDDYEKDYKGAISAGWDSLLLSRDGHTSGNEQSNVRDLRMITILADLIPELEKYASR
jgi:FMN phosphatase YigB (HAD superfamily)